MHYWRIDGWTDGQRDGPMDRPIDGLTDGWTAFYIVDGPFIAMLGASKKIQLKTGFSESLCLIFFILKILLKDAQKGPKCSFRALIE